MFCFYQLMKFFKRVYVIKKSHLFVDGVICVLPVVRSECTIIHISVVSDGVFNHADIGGGLFVAVSVSFKKKSRVCFHATLLFLPVKRDFCALRVSCSQLQ